MISVGPGALTMQIRKTSAEARFRGTAEVQRTLLSSLQVSKPGWKWRVILPVIGSLGGAVAGLAIGGRVDTTGWIISEGAADGFLIGAVGGGGLDI